MSDDMTAEEKIKKARVKLLKTAPFFGYLALYLRPVREDRILTMGVNMDGDLSYNEEFVNKMGEKELVFCLSHECLHVGFNHIPRCKQREKTIWNFSTDLSINRILDENNLMLPEFKSKYLRDPEFDENFEEEIYDKLMKKVKIIKIPISFIADLIYGNGEPEKSGKGKDGKMQEGSGSGKGGKEGKEDIDKIWEEAFKDNVWKGRLVEAAQYAKSQGIDPAGLDRLFDKMLFPQVGWKQLLYKYISNSIVSDYSWNRPNRRFVHQGLYFPSAIKENVELVLCVDSSGSISKEMLSEFYAELIGIRDSFENIHLTVIVCDAEIHEIIDIKNHEEPEIKMKGGGGTSFEPPINWVDENMPNARIMIYLTDLYGTFPKYAPRYAVIWAHKKESESVKIPFGERIVID